MLRLSKKLFKSIFGSWRKPKIMDTKGKQKLKVMFYQPDKVSQTQAAISFKCSQQYICKTLKKYTSIRKRKKILIPIVKEMWKIILNFKNLGWIIDDESIFTLSNSSSNGNCKFFTSIIRLAPENVK